MSIHVTKEAIYTSPSDAKTAENEFKDHSYPWEVAPLWVKYAATDKNDEIWFFNHLPHMDKVYWSTDECLPTNKGQLSGFYGNGADWQNSLREIPAREAELNRIADEISDYGFLCGIFKNVFSFDEWKERRRIRIEAGRIESVEDDLTWLAKNVNEWPENAKKAQEMLAGKNIYWRGEYFITYNTATYTKDQWLQRRIELGLATNPAEQPVSTDKEWDGEGLPPVGSKVEMSDGKRFFEANIEAYGVSGDSVMWDFEGVIDCASLDHCSFRPIDTEAKQREALREKFEAFAMDYHTITNADKELMWESFEAGYRLVKDGE